MEKDLKRCAVRFMGNKCIVCGYDRCLRALCFHHIIPSKKAFNISKKIDWEEIESELKKCVLLCNRCHSEVHDGIISYETLVSLATGRNFRNLKENE